MYRVKIKNKSKIKKEYFKALVSSKFNSPKEHIVKRFNRLKKEDKIYGTVFSGINFCDIIFVEPENVKCFINLIEIRIIEQSKIIYSKKNDKKKFIYTFKEELKKLFDYKGKFQKIIASFFEKDSILNPRVCYYCNIDFINTYDKDSETKNKFTLDHFLDKGTYPYLALSLYNLVPSCYVCNSKIKHDKNFTTPQLINTNPYLDTFDFDKKVKFKLFMSEKCENLSIKNKDDIKIPLKEKYTNKYDVYIKEFQLNERYNAHKDIVIDMLTKAELYPESRLKELQNLTGIPFQQIKKDIFNLIDEDKNMADVQFSKLINDISEELGIK